MKTDTHTPEVAEQTEVDRLFRRLRGLEQQQLRRGFLFDLVQKTPKQFVALFVLAFERRDQRPGREVYLDCLRLLSDIEGLSYSIREEAYICAVQSGNPVLRTAFIEQSKSIGTKVAYNLPELDEITLGRRKSLARTADRDMRMKLILDTEPSVIAMLLRNPRILESDVLRIVSRRPVPVGVLEVVFQNGAWGNRPSVIEALAYNPYTSPSLACPLVPLLPKAVRDGLKSGSFIHDWVRAAAEHMDGNSEPFEAIFGGNATD
ncbi:MAG: hypothetical protein CMH54_15730 [Myxococcales bacterium]|nr:hypothetical protein [Myxococcales bacterium]